MLKKLFFKFLCNNTLVKREYKQKIGRYYYEKNKYIFKIMLLTSSACFLGNITSISFKNTNIINDKSFNKVNLKADNEGKKSNWC